MLLKVMKKMSSLGIKKEDDKTYTWTLIVVVVNCTALRVQQKDLQQGVNKG